MAKVLKELTEVDLFHDFDQWKIRVQQRVSVNQEYTEGDKHLNYNMY